MPSENRESGVSDRQKKNEKKTGITRPVLTVGCLIYGKDSDFKSSLKIMQRLARRLQTL